MAKEKRTSGLISHGIAAQNRKGRFDYSIKETVEAGIVLKGPEVKSLRHGRASGSAWVLQRDYAICATPTCSRGGWSSADGAWTPIFATRV